MQTLLRFVTICCALPALLWAIPMPALADAAMPPPLTMIGLADLIVVGTITEVHVVPDAPEQTTEQATATVARVLKGTVNTAVTFRYLSRRAPVNGMLIEDDFAVTLPPHMSCLLYLKRTHAGYTLVSRGAGVRPATDTDAVAQQIAAFPVSLTAETPIPPLYFGEPRIVRVKLKNLTNGVIQVRDEIQAESFFFSPRMTSPMQFDVLPPPARELAPLPPPDIQPGEERVIPMMLISHAPASWAIFTPDTYLQTPAAVRILLTVDLAPGPRDATPRYPEFTVATPWMTTMTGYAPPTALVQ